MNKIHNHRAEFRTKFHTGCIYWDTLGTPRGTRMIIREVYKTNRLDGMTDQEARDRVLLWLVKNPITAIRKAVEL
jgi:hypothetical protein